MSLLPNGIAISAKIAEYLGVSERTLHRKLSETGMSFQKVLDQFRREEAERLLIQGHMEYVDIALSLGFSDQATWSRSFKRVSGTTPSAWVSQNRSI